MKFTGAIAFALAALPSVFCAAIPEAVENALVDRNLETRAFGAEIVASIKKVNASTAALDQQVLKVKSADLTQLLAVNTAAQNLGTVIKTETANVKKQQPVDVIGALNIQLATGDLISAVQSLSKDIINIKKYTDQAGVSSVVLQQLQSQKTAADAFADAVASKIPSLLSAIADLDKQQVDTALNNAIKAYGGSTS